MADREKGEEGGASEPHESGLSDEGAETMLRQAFELWINPEVEKRHSAGEISIPLELRMAQRLQRPDGSVVVRLNDEVRGIARIRANRPIEKGDDVLLSDFDGLESFDVPDEELDCGHWTLIWTGKKWFCSFNFLSNRAKCKNLLEKARQFLIASKGAYQMGHVSVAVDTLFSACELVSKAELVSSHMIKVGNRTHGQVASKINFWAKLGNIEPAFVELFNRMGNLRPRFRYDHNFSDLTPISDDDFELVDALIAAGIDKFGTARTVDNSGSKSEEGL